MTKLHSLILAGGQGKRMKSDLPKVCHKLNNKSMIEHVFDTVLSIDNVANKYVILGEKTASSIGSCLVNYSYIPIIQKDPKGTGHAVIVAREELESIAKNNPDDILLVMPGDAPLVNNNSINQMMKLHKEVESDLTLMCAYFDNPFGFGRIIRGDDNFIEKIVEQKDGTPDELNINLVNGSVYIFNIKKLVAHLSELELETNNAANEIYLTDIVKIFKKYDYKIIPYIIDDHNEISNVNTPEELARINQI
jgi:bifunctional UDP-N-acetylglucosamine pyrophosphorylase/glucosamine-1-phosphate N-acetyltransferase